MLVRRMTLPRRFLVLLALLLPFGPGPEGVMAAVGDAADVFTVADVEADVTAGSAAAAREQAIQRAQREAFARLFARLTPAADGQRPPDLDDDTIAQLVDAFEVEGERASAVRYIGRFTVRFRPQAVRNLMLANGIRYAEVRSKPVLVLPVDQTLGEPVLWQRETAWRQTWEQTEPPVGLVPVLVPYGELPDVTDIGVAEALAGDQAALRRIAERYGAGAVAVVQAGLDGALAPPPPVEPAPVLVPGAAPGGPPVPTPPAESVAPPPAAVAPPPAKADARPRGLSVLATIHRFDGAAPETVFFELPPPPQVPADASTPPPVSPPADSGAAPIPEGPPPGVLELMPQAVARTVTALEQSWIAANLLETGQSNRLTVSVPFADAQEWAETRRRLAAVPTVTRTRIVSLSRAGAEIDLTYLGDTGRLRTALAQRDLVLTEPAPPPAILTPGTLGAALPPGPDAVWTLQWRGAPSAQPVQAQPAPTQPAPAGQTPPVAQ